MFQKWLRSPLYLMDSGEGWGWGSFAGVKHPACGDEHSSESSAEVKNMCSCTSTPSLLKEGQGEALCFTLITLGNKF
jgi:hypothetical protein